MNFENLIDISRVIASDSVVYPGDPPLAVNKLCQIEPGCPCNISQVSWTTHFLTHVDPPLHFIEGGASLDEVHLHRFTGDTLVVEVKGDAVLPMHVPQEAEVKGRNLLFKTRNSQATDSQAFDENHAYISAEAAEMLAARGANLVGIDYLSVDRFGDESYPAHRAFLGNGVLILEGLDLSRAAAGRYDLVAFPLKIAGGDGSPVRAVLVPR